MTFLTYKENSAADFAFISTPLTILKGFAIKEIFASIIIIAI